MAAFQCILHLIVLNGFILPGLSLPSSASATPVESLSSTQQRHVTSQKQTEFPIPLEGEIIVVVFGQHNGKARTGTLELDGETGEDHPGDGDNVVNIEQVSPDDGERQRTEFEKVKKNWGEYRKLNLDKRDDLTDYNTPPMKPRLNSVRVKRSEDKTDENTPQPRTWRNNIIRVWGKRSDSDRKSSGHTGASGKANETDKHRGVLEGKRQWQGFSFERGQKW